MTRSSNTAHRPEILAPAGTWESFRAALASGADAVYLGLAEGFNARARSDAFTRDQLPELVRTAHRAGAKLYLTLNTLVFERELDTVATLIADAAQADVDALIVQDPAVALLARRVSPELRLHASTQMTISSVEGAAFAATLGIVRVVLPRELSTREIARFTAESPLEAEVFIHGALCMAWSGQCLTSEALSNRSANRGQCSQACRMPYDLVVDGERRDLGEVRYLLSPQDLAGASALPELIGARVHGLKIEGRYKNAAYVATAVDTLRNFRDALLRGATDADRVRLERDELHAQLTFSRGASPGFLRGDAHQTLVVGKHPGHRGLAIGRVHEVDATRVRIVVESASNLSDVLRRGMGVMFDIGDPEAQDAPGGPIFHVEWLSSGPPQLELGFGSPGPNLKRVRVGDVVRLTGDPELGREAERRIDRSLDGGIPLVLRVTGVAGEALRLEGEATLGGREIVVSVPSRTPLREAASQGLSAELLERKLGALGGTPFYLAELDAAGLAPQLHIDLSELKPLRRELVAQLEAALFSETETVSPPHISELRAELIAQTPPEDGPAQLIPLCRTLEQLDAVLATRLASCREVELDFMELVGLRQAVERARGAGLRVTLATIRVQKPGEESYDRRIAALKPDAVLVRHWGALMHFADSSVAPDGLPVHGDFSLNVTNSLTALHLLKLGLRTITASHDLDRGQLLDLLDAIPTGRLALTLHHHIPTFHNSHCVYAHLLSEGNDYRTCGRPCERHRIALRDFAGHEHPVVVDVGCRNTVFNAVAQSAAPLVPTLLARGVRRFRVEFVWEGAAEVERTLRHYDALLAGRETATAVLRVVGVHEQYGLTHLRR